MRLAIPFLILSACTGPLVVSAGSAEVSAPESIDFGETALNFSRVKPLILTNRGKVPRTVSLVTTPPFVAPASIDLPGATDVTVDIIFRPTTAGPATGTVTIDGLVVSLAGTGVAAMSCGSGGPCASVRFDPETLSCVTTNVTDGTACEDELACIERGVCQAGTCIGRAARCDDGDACTSDSCSVGRGCQHAAMECAPPANPCLAPTCDPVSGCGTAPVQDGTPCGSVSCELANVCLAGTCRAVVPPDGFTCSPESACRGEGTCRNKVCVRPAERALTPRWVATSTFPSFRFEGTVDDQGNFYWVECTTLGLQNGAPRVPVSRHQCEVVSRTQDGLERFRVTVDGTGPLEVPPLGSQLVTHGTFVFVVSRDHLAAVDTHTGALVWDRVVNAGSWVQRLAADGAGELWATAELASGTGVLLKLAARTGIARVIATLPAPPSALFANDRGDAFVTMRALTKPSPVPPTTLERYDATGQRRFSVTVTAPLEMVLSDALVFANDSVRSPIDGTERTGAHTLSDYQGLIGVSPGRGAERMRLSRPSAIALPATMTDVRLETIDSAGARQTVFSTPADRALSPFLTSSGDALFVSTKPGESRVQQIHRLGAPLMSCALVDDQQGIASPLTLGTQAFNGRVLLINTGWDPCPSCLENRDALNVIQPRLVAFDLGRTGPGLSSRGWVAPRGSVANTARAR